MVTNTNLLTALGAVAWADGVLRPEEARFFAQVVAGLDLDADREAAIFRQLLVPPPIAALDLTELDDDDRQWLLGFGYLMASADGEVAPEEMAVLEALAKRVDIAWEDAQKLFEEAESIKPAVTTPWAEGDR